MRTALQVARGSNCQSSRPLGSLGESLLKTGILLVNPKTEYPGFERRLEANDYKDYRKHSGHVLLFFTGFLSE